MGAQRQGWRERASRKSRENETDILALWLLCPWEEVNWMQRTAECWAAGWHSHCPSGSAQQQWTGEVKPFLHLNRPSTAKFHPNDCECFLPVGTPAWHWIRISKFKELNCFLICWSSSSPNLSGDTRIKCALSALKVHFTGANGYNDNEAPTCL